MYKRPVFHTILKRIQEPRRFIQILAGPRQTGKTTLARQLMDSETKPTHYASADEPGLKGNIWIEQQWQIGRRLIKSNSALIVLDEIHKITNWSETVKRLWDEDTALNNPLHVLLLGSSLLLLHHGLSESLAGRFEIIPISHWSFPEMQTAFSWDLNQYIFYGGYPGAATLIYEHERWSNYIMNSLIESTISRDILLLTRIDKPALLRRLFELGCLYSGQILSFQKMIGQLQDAGNTTTLAHYLRLLEGAGLIAGLSKYSGQHVRKRASSPKLMVYNTALMSAFSQLSFKESQQNNTFWGRLTESAIGAHFLNQIRGTGMQLYYWNERNHKVDFILQKGDKIVAIEVKSSYRKEHLPGMTLLSNRHQIYKKWLVGADGIPIKECLQMNPKEFFD